MFVITLIPTIC